MFEWISSWVRGQQKHSIQWGLSLEEYMASQGAIADPVFGDYEDYIAALSIAPEVVCPDLVPMRGNVLISLGHTVSRKQVDSSIAKTFRSIERLR